MYRMVVAHDNIVEDVQPMERKKVRGYSFATENISYVIMDQWTREEIRRIEIIERGMSPCINSASGGWLVSVRMKEWAKPSCHLRRQ